MPPLIATTIKDTRQALVPVRAQRKTVGLVPTMGALHEGHASLIRAARADNDFVVVTVFVNPTQFGPHEDFQHYPRPFAKDVALCDHEQVDLIFHPEPAVLYPPGYQTFVEVQNLQNLLCGASRPGHFRGVATVVLKLFNIVQPDRSYFGQKDAQQVRLLQQLVTDLNVPVQLQVCPIVRAADGLALSSRNQYLDPEQRRQAVALSQTLEVIRRLVAAGQRDGRPLVEIMKQRLAAIPGTRLDYAAVVAYDTLQPLEILSGKVLVALAVYFGSTRLIDNILLDMPVAP